MTLITPGDQAAIGPIHTATLGLQARLEKIFPTVRFQHELLPAPVSLKIFFQLPSTRAPLIALHFVGLKPDAGNGRTYKGTIQFNLGLVTSNVRVGPRLLGDAQAPGIAQMAHAAILGLQGFQPPGFGPAGVGPVEVGDANTVDGAEWSAKHLVAMGVGLSMRATWQQVNPDEFLRFGATWSFDPAPDDGPAAASDLYNVRES